MKGFTNTVNFKPKPTVMSLFRHTSVYVSGMVTDTSEVEKMLLAHWYNMMFRV